MAVRQELFIKEAHITTKLLHGFHTGFGILSDFPVSVFFGSSTMSASFFF